MPATAKPDVSTPWGVNGELNDPGVAKRELGFVDEIPEYPDFNWVINNLGVFAKYLNEQGIGCHDLNTVYWVGGIVKGSDNKLYQSLQNDNAGHVVTDAAWWRELVFGTRVKTTVITVSNPAWVPDPLTKAIEFTIQAAGGGGGGVDGQGAGNAGYASGGNGGNCVFKVDNDVAASYALVIGAGGLGGSAGANDGSVGGSSSVTLSLIHI